jgi:hypothetical protein
MYLRHSDTDPAIGDVPFELKQVVEQIERGMGGPPDPLLWRVVGVLQHDIEALRDRIEILERRTFWQWVKEWWRKWRSR